jgi:hypothetical protein
MRKKRKRKNKQFTIKTNKSIFYMTPEQKTKLEVDKAHEKLANLKKLIIK